MWRPPAYTWPNGWHDTGTIGKGTSTIRHYVVLSMSCRHVIHTSQPRHGPSLFIHVMPALWAWRPSVPVLARALWVTGAAPLIAYYAMHKDTPLPPHKATPYKLPPSCMGHVTSAACRPHRLHRRLAPMCKAET